MLVMLRRTPAYDGAESHGPQKAVASSYNWFPLCSSASTNTLFTWPPLASITPFSSSIIDFFSASSSFLFWNKRMKRSDESEPALALRLKTSNQQSKLIAFKKDLRLLYRITLRLLSFFIMKENRILIILFANLEKEGRLAATCFFSIYIPFLRTDRLY